MDELTKEFIAESQEGLDRMEICLTELEKRPDDGELMSEIFRAVHNIKGTTGFLGFSRLEALAHTGESLLGTLRDGKITVTSEVITGLLSLMDGLRRILRLIEATGTEGLRSTDDDCELIALLAKLKAGSGKLGVDRQSTFKDRDAGRTDLLLTPAAAWSTQDKTLRIDVEVLNQMMNLVGELVLTRNQILQSSPGAENFPELARALNNVTTALRESVMQARMQPVGHLFGKFPRMVRDLGRTCGRQVRIEFEGQETGLDKSLLEAIRDPLTHAVRNSVGHGIEPAEERVKAGKPAEGVVRMRAFQQSGSVVIEVIDDGGGIPAAEILKKAVERGLVTAEKAAAMTEREALQLIFVAGFSTAKELTHISGRGVGMDVVRANVEQVGGSVEVESRVGSGTTVRLRVPLTLAIVSALVVRSGGQSFALPQNSLVELVYVARRDAAAAVERIGTTELYRLREGLLPLVWLDRLLELQQSGSAESRGFYIAVLEAEGLRFGLVVDDLKAPEEIVVKSLSAVLREIGVFSGATMLGNGMLAMILDVAAIGVRAGVRPAAEAANESGGDAEMTRSEGARVDKGRTELESSMVIYESWKGELGQRGNPARMALPLSAVERIERVPIGEIEYAGGRAMLQYDGELLPLEDEDEVLSELRADGTHVGQVRDGTGAGEEAAHVSGGMATVLICLRPGARGARRVGIVVRRVLDVSAGTLLEADEVLCEGRLAMVENRVTMVHSELVEQEVA